MREVTLEATGPVRFDEDDLDEKYGDIAVCRCGLSGEFPLCDGSHKRTEPEEPGVRYKYVDGERRVVEEIRYADGEKAGDGGGDGGSDADGDGSEAE